MTFTTSVTATTEIGRLTIGTMTRQKICVSVAPSTRAASSTSVLMPLMAADRITVANPTEPQMPTAISAQLTVSGLPSNDDRPGADDAEERVQEAGLGVGRVDEAPDDGERGGRDGLRQEHDGLDRTPRSGPGSAMTAMIRPKSTVSDT